MNIRNGTIGTKSKVMNIIIKNLFLGFIFIISCVNHGGKTKEMSIFLRTPPHAPCKHGIITLLIENDKIYTNENLLVAGDNKLLYRILDLEEKETLKNELEKVDYLELEQKFIDNKYDANFEHDIYINYNQLNTHIKIFQDTIPKQYISLIAYLEELRTTGNYDILKSRIVGIDDANLIIPMYDSISPSFKQSFYLWKYLMCYNGVLDTLSSTDFDIYKVPYKYSFSYGLDYKGRKLNKLIIENNQVILIYETGQVLRLNEPLFFE